MGIILIFIKNFPKYAFISISRVPYEPILADYKSGSHGEMNNNIYILFNINY